MDYMGSEILWNDRHDDIYLLGMKEEAKERGSFSDYLLLQEMEPDRFLNTFLRILSAVENRHVVFEGPKRCVLRNM